MKLPMRPTPTIDATQFAWHLGCSLKTSSYPWEAFVFYKLPCCLCHLLCSSRLWECMGWERIEVKFKATLADIQQFIWKIILFTIIALDLKKTCVYAWRRIKKCVAKIWRVTATVRESLLVSNFHKYIRISRCVTVRWVGIQHYWHFKNNCLSVKYVFSSEVDDILCKLNNLTVLWTHFDIKVQHQSFHVFFFSSFVYNYCVFCDYQYYYGKSRLAFCRFSAHRSHGEQQKCRRRNFRSC